MDLTDDFADVKPDISKLGAGTTAPESISSQSIEDIVYDFVNAESCSSGNTTKAPECRREAGNSLFSNPMQLAGEILCPVL
jgi:hypothetical protein